MSTLPTPQISVTDDLDLLLQVMPPRVREVIEAKPHRADLLEVVLDLGRPPEARFPDRGEVLSPEPVSRADLDTVVERVGRFGKDNRAGIERTLHRISAIRNRDGDVVGLTCRVGRAVFGTVEIVRDVVESGRSLLLLGRPGVGKTTLLREAARVLADDLGKRVVVVDTSNEIAGDGDVPHPGIGRARRMQVPVPAVQDAVMIEAVENHMPEVIVIDEIGTQAEAFAARTIAERGVQLIATAHGNTLENLLQNPTLSDLIGGVQVVTLGDEEARRRGTQKTVPERKAPPTFDVLIEIQTKDTLAVHHDVAEVVDRFLRGEPPRPQVRLRTVGGEVEIRTPDRPMAGAPRPADWTAPGSGRWSHSGAPAAPGPAGPTPSRARHPRPLEAWSAPPDDEEPFGDFDGEEPAEPDAGEPPPPALRWPGTGGPPERPSRILRIFSYAVSRARLERAIRKLRLPAFLVDDLAKADVILTTKAQERRQPRRLREAQERGKPLYTLRTNTIVQIEKFLLGVFREDASALAEQKAAMREVESAVHEVMEQGQPIELTPRRSALRRAQHELAGQHHVPSESRGVEPFRRVVIFPP